MFSTAHEMNKKIAFRLRCRGRFGLTRWRGRKKARTRACGADKIPKGVLELMF